MQYIRPQKEKIKLFKMFIKYKMVTNNKAMTENIFFYDSFIFQNDNVHNGWLENRIYEWFPTVGKTPAF